MTELRWEGKYLNDRKVAPVKLALPFQTIETVNESVEQRMSLFSAPAAQTEWRNRLIWGDKKYVLPSLLTEFAGKVNLIYIDPPFDTGANFSFTTTIPNAPAEAYPDGEEGEGGSFVKQPSVIEQKAYRDTWGRGLDSYLQWFYETALLLRDLPADDGSIYVHLDWHVGHYAKIVLDEVFGYENFRNEIVWVRSAGRANVKTGYSGGHDVILFYTKNSNPIWNKPFVPLSDKYVEGHYNLIEPKTGRMYSLDNMISPNPDRPNLKYEWNGVIRVWRVTKSNMQQLYDEGRIVYTKQGVARYKRYLDESEGTPLSTVWQDIPPVNSQATERVEYRTQKPEPLLERVIKASSNAGDLVLDCFCGSGTTAAVAEKLGRRWITCDLGRFAIHTARKRLLGIASVKPFVVQNLGKYERQQWMMAELQPNLNVPGLNVAQAAPTLLEQRLVREESYRKFILDLYRATSLTGGYTWLHGAKSGRLVHVGGVDAPVALGDVQNILKEFWKVGGRPSDGKTGAAHTNGIDILGWEFAFDINETASQMAAANNVNLRLIKIPREVLEKKAVEQGDIRFFELAFVNVSVKQNKKQFDLALTDFVMPPDDVPQEIQANISHWSQWVDYWAVDWDFKNDTFHNQWQSYRTRQSTKLTLATEHHYAAPGTYEVVVKVIDILGNDTTKTLTISV